MSLSPRPLLIILAIMLSATAMAEPVSYSGHKLVRVDVFSPADLETLLRISPDIWSDAVGLGLLDARIPPEHMPALEASGLPYEVLIEDIGPLATAHLDSSLGRGTWDSYMDLAQMTAYINELAASKPELCEVFSIGTSIEGRDIWVLHLAGTNPDPKPAVFYHSTIHAREWITAPVVLYLATYLVDHYGSDPGVTAIVNGLDIYIAPCVNPDGYSYTWTDERMWRKNRRDSGGGTYGVDLNRNFGYAWGFDDSGSSPSPYSETYRGTAPFSEPETQALRDFFIAHPDIVAYMDYHSYGQYVMWPWGFQCTTPEEPHGTIFSTLGNTMADLITGVHGKPYNATPICLGLYSVNGGSVDWAWGDRGAYALTIELRDKGTYGFVLPPQQILPTCEENLPAIMYLTEWAAAYRGTTISLPAGVPDLLPPGVPTTIAVEIETKYDTIVPDSALLHYRYGGGAYQTLPLTHVDGSLHQVTLPAARCDDAPEFYFSVEGDQSGVIHLPPDAPTTTFAPSVGEIVTYYSQPLDLDPGWTTQGQWQFGPPTGQGGASYGHPDPSSGYTGDNVYGVNLAGDYSTTIGGPYYLLMGPIDLSDVVGTHLKFMRWLNSDYAPYVTNRVEVSSNGTDWVGVWSNGDSEYTDNAWVPCEYDIAGIVDGHSNVYVRWSYQVGTGAWAYSGWNIDDVALTVLACDDTPPFCAGDMNCDGVVAYDDIDPFVAALSCAGGAPECWPPTGIVADCPWLNADCNDDGSVTYADIDPFVARIGATCP